jgi:hypothetical protein
MEAEAPKPSVPVRDEQPLAESKPERSGLAAFFGFAQKPQTESEQTEAKPSRKGWWQRPADK